MGWSSDRSQERRWHIAAPMMVASLGFLLCGMLQDRAVLAVAMLCVTSAGLHGYQPGLWSLPSGFLAGSAAAATIGMVNSVGSLGGFAGPYIVGYLNKATNSFFRGMLCLSLASLVAACFFLALRQGRRKIAVSPSSAD
jgi:ACS family tartrate transporter-like MFS transporter